MRARVLHARPRRRRARALFCVIAAVAIVTALHVTARAASDIPIRAYWVPRTAIGSPETIQRALLAIQSGGFDTVFVPIAAAQGDPRPGFDGVGEFIREARLRHLRVHGWIDVNRVASADEFPDSRDHVVYQHPEWLMVPRVLAPELLSMDPRGPAYLGQLSRWTRANPDRVDGLYISPLDPDAALYLADRVTMMAKRYAVDGVHLDALRFPGSDFDYSRRAMDLFRADERARLSLFERARLDEIEAIDPFGYAAEFQTKWEAFRRARLTALMARIRTSLKNVNSLLTITANVSLDDDAAREEQFQDWRSWIAERLLDGVSRRTGSNAVILVSPDGVFPATPTPLPVAGQASAAGGSR